MLNPARDKLLIESVRFGSEAAHCGLAPGGRDHGRPGVGTAAEPLLVALPALALLAGIVALQRRRHRLKLAPAR